LIIWGLGPAQAGISLRGVAGKVSPARRKEEEDGAGV